MSQELLLADLSVCRIDHTDRRFGWEDQLRVASACNTLYVRRSYSKFVLYSLRNRNQWRVRNASVNVVAGSQTVDHGRSPWARATKCLQYSAKLQLLRRVKINTMQNINIFTRRLLKLKKTFHNRRKVSSESAQMTSLGSPFHVRGAATATWQFDGRCHETVGAGRPCRVFVESTTQIVDSDERTNYVLPLHATLCTLEVTASLYCILCGTRNQWRDRMRALQVPFYGFEGRDLCWLWLIDWVKVLRPTQYKIGPFWRRSLIQSLGLAWRN